MRTSAVAALLALSLLPARTACGHETRPGYLELREREAGTYAFLWKRPVGGEVAIEIAPILPPGCVLREPGRQQPSPGAAVLRGELLCEGGIAGRTLKIAGLESTLTDVLVRVQHADGRIESHLVKPAAPAFVLGTFASAWKRTLHYVRLGVEHILLGIDHLLFVLGLLLVVADRWMLVKTVSAFTLAHSLTLAAATLGHASAPLPPLNVAIALSILFLGPEAVRYRRGETSFTIRHPWGVAFAFGLLHGFGFATGLAAMGLPRTEIPLALLFFNVGVEIGQVTFVALIVLLERSFRALEIAWPQALELLPAYAVGCLGAYWTIQRTLLLFAGTS